MDCASEITNKCGAKKNKAISKAAQTCRQIRGLRLVFVVFIINKALLLSDD